MARQGTAGQLHPAFMPGTHRGHIRALHLNDPATRYPEVLIMRQRAWTRTIPMHHPFHPMSGFTGAQAKGADR